MSDKVMSHGLKGAEQNYDVFPLPEENMICMRVARKQDATNVMIKIDTSI